MASNNDHKVSSPYSNIFLLCVNRRNSFTCLLDPLTALHRCKPLLRTPTTTSAEDTPTATPATIATTAPNTVGQTVSWSQYNLPTLLWTLTVISSCECTDMETGTRRSTGGQEQDLKAFWNAERRRSTSANWLGWGSSKVATVGSRICG